MKKNYLGIDLGGTAVKIAIVDNMGRIIEQKALDHKMPSSPKTIVSDILRAYKSLKTKGKIYGTGIGVAGDVDQKLGRVRFSPNIKWKNVGLLKMLKGKLPHPIVVDNDANAAAWGAYWLEAKGKVKNLVCVTLGTGVGGGIIVNGEIYHGATGSAGEIGHINYEPNGPKCGCGSHGCIESYLGARYIVSEAKKWILKDKKSLILKLIGNDLSKLTPKILTDAAEMGDETAKHIWDIEGRRLGIFIADLINILNPDMIVFAGGVSKAGKFILDPAKRAAKERAYAAPFKACKIVISEYDHRLGVVGSALLLKKK